MHSGFMKVREGMSFNLCFLPRVPEASPDALAEAQEVLELWEAALTRPERRGGPYLCGAFCAADVMFATMAARLQRVRRAGVGLPAGPRVPGRRPRGAARRGMDGSGARRCRPCNLLDARSDAPLLRPQHLDRPAAQRARRWRRCPRSPTTPRSRAAPRRAPAAAKSTRSPCRASGPTQARTAPPMVPTMPATESDQGEFHGEHRDDAAARRAQSLQERHLASAARSGRTHRPGEDRDPRR